MKMIEIKNQEALTRIFGEWPSFHDAEIVSLLLARGGEEAPSLTAKIHLWQMTSAVDPKGYFVCKNHTLATLRFGRIVLEQLDGFNGQNVLFDLNIENIDPNAPQNEGCRFEVIMQTSYGCQGIFKCRSISVLSAEPHPAYPAQAAEQGDVPDVVAGDGRPA